MGSLGGRLGSSVVLQAKNGGGDRWGLGIPGELGRTEPPKNPTLSIPPPKKPQSKGGILSKACDYVRELRQSNQRLQETFKEAERLQMDNDLLRQQVPGHAPSP